MDSIEIYFSFLTVVLAISLVCTIVSDTIITTDNSISVLFWCCMPGLNVIVAAWMIYHLTKLIPALSIKETVQSCLRPPWKERNDFVFPQQFTSNINLYVDVYGYFGYIRSFANHTKKFQSGYILGNRAGIKCISIRVVLLSFKQTNPTIFSIINGHAVGQKMNVSFNNVDGY